MSETEPIEWDIHPLYGFSLIVTFNKIVSLQEHASDTIHKRQFSHVIRP
jgi:hypothetical protein